MAVKSLINKRAKAPKLDRPEATKFKVGELITAANLRIVGIVNPDARASKVKYKVKRLCCERIETLRWDSIRGKILKNITLCRTCGFRAANISIVTERKDPKPLPAITEEILKANQQATKNTRKRIEDIHEGIRLDKEIFDRYWDSL